jgi:ribosome-associated heat shock protein Hsp15
MRLDLLLVRLRLAKSRAVAQRRIAEGHLRCNGQRAARQDFAVKSGDVLTLPHGTGVQVIRLLALPERRGPPVEARGCYQVLDAGPAIAIADQTAPPATIREAMRTEGIPHT